MQYEGATSVHARLRDSALSFRAPSRARGSPADAVMAALEQSPVLSDADAAHVQGMSAAELSRLMRRMLDMKGARTDALHEVYWHVAHAPRPRGAFGRHAVPRPDVWADARERLGADARVVERAEMTYTQRNLEVGGPPNDILGDLRMWPRHITVELCSDSTEAVRVMPNIAGATPRGLARILRVLAESAARYTAPADINRFAGYIESIVVQSGSKWALLRAFSMLSDAEIKAISPVVMRGIADAAKRVGVSGDTQMLNVYKVCA